MEAAIGISVFLEDRSAYDRAVTNTRQYVEQSRPAGTNALFVAWTTLTHANNPH